MNDMIESVTADWKILITDASALKVLSWACTMNDVLAKNVTLVENLALARHPYENMDGIYFIAPVAASLDLALKDFDKKRKTYKQAHFFFLGKVSDDLFDRITSHPISKYIKTFQELFCDLLAFESQVYLSDLPAATVSLFSPETQDTIREYEVMAKTIASACALKGDLPTIRYFNSPMKIAAKLASLVQEQLDDMISAAFPNVSNGKTTLLILDRSFDIVSPLLREFTYQAMACDLLPIKDGVRYEFDMEDSGRTRHRIALLNELDPFWIELRHTHIAETIQGIIDKFNRFSKENESVIKAAQGEGQASTSVSSLAEMKETLGALPQFQEMKNKFSVHLNIAQSCMKMFEEMQMGLTAGFEQDMATGWTFDGKEVKNILPAIKPSLLNPTISDDDKIRLLMLYIIEFGGITEDDKQKFMDYAKLTNEDLNPVYNLGYFGIKIIKEKGDKTMPPKKPKPKYESDEDVPYEWSRYAPPLENISMAAIKGNLDTNAFPYLRPLASVAKAAITAETSKPGPKQASKWDIQKQQQQQSKPALPQETNESSRLIIYIAGGVTYSEIRAIYKVSEYSECDIIVGGSNVLTTSAFLESLKQLKAYEAFE